MNTIAQNGLWISRILPGSPGWDWIELGYDFRHSIAASDRWPSQPFNDSQLLGQSQALEVRRSTEITSSKPRLSILSLSYSGHGTLEPFHVFETRWYYAFRYCCKQLLLKSRVAFRGGSPGS